MIENLEKLYKIYEKIDSTKMHKKFTNMRSLKLATILNKMFYYLEYAGVLISKKDIKNDNYYKYNIVITIGRNMMELFNVYEYFGESGISNDEYELRKLCADFHETISEEKIDAKLEEYNKEKFDQLTVLYPSCNFLRLIKLNSVYQNSSDKWKKTLLSSKKCYYFSRKVKKMNIMPQALESSLYNIFSNFIHSFEMGLGYDFRRSNSHMYSGYYQAILSVQIMILYSSIMLKNYISRRNFKKIMTKSDLKFIDSLITIEDIEKTLLEWKNKFDFNKFWT